MRTRNGNRFRPPAARTWSIRAKIVSLLIVPLVALIAMWALATAVTLGPGLELLDAQNAVEHVGRPTQSLLRELQAERKASLVHLASGSGDQSALLAQRARTDAAQQTLTTQVEIEGRAAAGQVTTARLDELFRQLDSLAAMRAAVDRGESDRTTTFGRYTQLIETGFLVTGSLAGTEDADLAPESRALLGFTRAREVLAQEDALVSAALTAGTISSPDLVQTIQLIGTQRYLFAETQADLNATDRAEYQALTRTEPFTALVALENRLIAETRPGLRPPVDPAAWSQATTTVATQLQELEVRATDRLADRGAPTAWVIIGQILVAGLLGLVTVVVTIVASVRIGRSLLKRLAGLRQAALELAVDRLPRVVARLRQGEEVDVDHDAPPLPYGDDEIGQVGHAFNELQRTAVNSAVEEATLRRGLNEVFLNIARRSQTLLHRQLSILDRMERRADDPTELEDLFRVDHLATRMRRHAEDLVILAGAAPGRGWRNPVPVVDVLRGAVSEVEDYARVSIRPTPEVAIAGRAVGDVIHLLAELIENATSFSPPHTRVNVGGDVVTHGFAIEIEDRGLGMTAEALAECNARLTDPPDFDPANSAQLGLFVVARLAARHGVRVQLRPSPYGGVTAVVLLPDEIIAAPGALPAGAVGALPAGDDDPRINGGAVYRAFGPRQAIAAGPTQPTEALPIVPAQAEAPNAATVIVEPSRPRSRHARQEVIEPADPSDGLPKRVRQTSLAPQLRDGPPAEEPPPPGPGGSNRTPEQLRAMMTSFQAGMTRGRRDAESADATQGDGMAERESR